MTISKCICSKCHGHFIPSEGGMYKGRLMCGECIGDEQMWDAIAEQERRLDDYLSSLEVA